MAHIAVDEELTLSVAEVPGPAAAFGKGLAPVGVGACGHGQFILRTVKHQPGDFVNREARGQVGGTFGDREAPVGIRQKGVSAVETLESQAVGKNNGDTRAGTVAQCGTATLVHKAITVLVLVGDYVFHIFVGCRQAQLDKWECEQ